MQYSLPNPTLATKSVTATIINASDYDDSTHDSPILATTQLSANETNRTLQFSLDQYSHDIKLLIADNDNNDFLIEKITVASDDYVYTDRYLKTILFDLCILSFAIAVLYICKKTHSTKERLQQIAILATLWMIIGISVFPFLQYPDTILPATSHDYEFHFGRMRGIAEAFTNGQFPARINMAANRGAGSINNILYPELFLYLPALFVYLGSNPHVSFVLFFMMINIASVVLGYWSFFKISNSRMLSIATIAIYTLSNYKISNFYLRFALGEYLFMAFLPFMFYAVYHIFYQGGKHWWLLTIAASCILQSHILGTAMTAVMFALIIIILFISYLLTKKSIIRPFTQLCLAAGWTILLNAWFLIPFISTYLSGEIAMFDAAFEFETKFSPQKIIFNELFAITPKIFHYSLNMSLGTPVILALWLCIVLTIYCVLRKQKAAFSAIIGCLVASALFVCFICAHDFNIALATQSDLFLSIFGTLQFSWRTLSVLTASICCGFLLSACFIRNKWIKIVLCIALTLLSFGNFFSSEIACYVRNPHRVCYSIFPEEYRHEGTNTWNQWATYCTNPVYNPDDLDLLTYEKNSSNVTLSYATESPTDAFINLPMFFYQGYQAIDQDGTPYNLVVEDTGLLRLIIPANSSGTVFIHYVGRKLYSLSNLITLFASLGFCLLCLPTRYQFTFAKISKHLPQTLKQHLPSTKQMTP